jgi:hypothetical protein
VAEHADLGTTQRYADLDANDLRAAIERIDANALVTSKSELLQTPERRSKTPIVTVLHAITTPRGP